MDEAVEVERVLNEGRVAERMQGESNGIRRKAESRVE